MTRQATRETELAVGDAVEIVAHKAGLDAALRAALGTGWRSQQLTGKLVEHVPSRDRQQARWKVDWDVKGTTMRSEVVPRVFSLLAAPP